MTRHASFGGLSESRRIRVAGVRRIPVSPPWARLPPISTPASKTPEAPRVAFEVREAERRRAHRRCAVVNGPESQPAGRKALAVAEDRIEGLHEKHEQGQHVPVQGVGVLLVLPSFATHEIEDSHLEIGALKPRNHPDTSCAQVVGEFQSSPPVQDPKCPLRLFDEAHDFQSRALGLDGDHVRVVTAQGREPPVRQSDADVLRLVGLDDSDESEVAPAARLPDAVQHVPSRAVLAPKFLRELHRRGTLAGGHEGVMYTDPAG